MKVLKFGGTSVGSIESLCNVKSIVEKITDDKTVVVFSALGGITDRLIVAAHHAADGKPFHPLFYEIKDRHFNILEGLPDTGKKKIAEAALTSLLNDLEKILEGLSLIGDLSDSSLDLVVSFGERLSAHLLYSLIDNSQLLNPLKFILTGRHWDKTVFDANASGPAIEISFADFFKNDKKVALVPGFISADVLTGKITNLGRGGSDYTASIIAASLCASQLQIWTDVDGFMTADPKIIGTAYPIDRLTFTEALELCNFGAKVIYPPTIYPVFRADIPIVIKNTFNPSAKGTFISSKIEVQPNLDGPLIKGISSINDTSLISISGLGMVGIVGINARIFGALAKNGISVFMVSQASSENSTSLAVRDADAEKSVKVLEEEFSVEIAAGSISDIKVQSGLSTVGVVGANMRHLPGVAGRLFLTLGRNGINMIACAQGANQTNISFVVETRFLKKALNVIHDSFFLSQTQILNLFIVGLGKVGQSLIRQIDHQQAKLLKEKSLEIKIVGIANSRKALFDRNGIDLSHYRELLEKDGRQLTTGQLGDEVVGMNIFNPVFVDCTSSPSVASLYELLLTHNVNVVAANKFSASGPYEDYLKLKRIARRKDVKFLFETNVGAGLPIISTLNSLINSGDKILKIEAVLSGTLNFIFNEISAQKSLRKAIDDAVEAGYAEADPRVDLSGDDVVRKIVILARESGYRIDQKDVDRSYFIPNEFFEGETLDFMKKLNLYDDQFEKERLQQVSDGKRLRYIATLENGKARVGLKAIGKEHPFYNIEGSNNVIALTTERYHDQPIIIKGYGAGAEVTAAGVFADIISIANIR